MNIEHRVIARCCNLRQEHSNEWAALNTLLTHIHHEHKELYLELEKKGRKLARSQNGYGYYDDNSMENSDWHRAPSSFKQVYMQKALTEHLTRK